MSLSTKYQNYLRCLSFMDISYWPEDPAMFFYTNQEALSGGRTVSAVVNQHPPSPPPPPSSPCSSTASASQYFEDMAPVEPEQDHCTICNEVLCKSADDEDAETPSILPCGHVFGHRCISRWLHDSTHQNCPICRRRMTYRHCGHTVKPLPLEQSPRLVKEQEMPEKCLLCREGGEMLKEKMKWVQQRMDAEIRALEGLRVLRTSRGFASFGGLFCSRSSMDDEFGVRVGERKQIWEEECRRLENSMVRGRREW